jgi:hypothetical protein
LKEQEAGTGRSIRPEAALLQHYILKLMGRIPLIKDQLELVSSFPLRPYQAFPTFFFKTSCQY